MRLFVVAAQIGHAAEGEILAVGFVAFEFRLVDVDVAYWFIVGMRALCAARLLGGGDCGGR
jgi:hypothetical protein